ncbi:AAA family ATPase [Ensifer sp. MPMI2T]|nr:AAA family ATPase [Ensifer sp. MPMI2T]
MTDRSTQIAERMLSLRRIFAHHEAFGQLEEQFQVLLNRRWAEIAAGVSMEARGIAVIGASGSGKTTAVARLLSHTPGLICEDSKTSRMDIVSFQVPSPATLKFVGQTALEALGYPLRRERTEMTIWEMVRHHLQARQTLFLHLDEAQDLMRHQTPKMLQSVVRTLKSLMQTRDWPVGIILSGMRDLKELLNHDPQLARRFYPIEFTKLHSVTDGSRVARLAASYSDRAGLRERDLVQDQFAARLIHAADGEFGLVIELIIGSIEEALLSGDRCLDPGHFVRAFRRRSGCVDALNPFVAEDFERIDARALLQSEGLL